MLPEDQKRILGYFIEEAKDHLNTIEQGLLSLQTTIEDSEMVNEVFRAAHSVKGGAAMLGINSMQRTAHRLEDFFKLLKESPVRTDRELESLLLRIFDGLKEQLEQLQGPFGLTEDQASTIMATLEPVFANTETHLQGLLKIAPIAASQPTLVAAPAAMVTAPATHPETSALHLVFRSDIPGLLRDMLTTFKQEDTAISRQGLAHICQRLQSIGEQFELSPWCRLTQAVQRAVGNSQATYRSLAPVVIKDLKQAQERVLSNNAEQITPSAALLELVPAEPVIEVDTEIGTPEGALDALLAEALSGDAGDEDLADLFTTAEADSAQFGDAEDTDWLEQLTDTTQDEPATQLEAAFDNLREIPEGTPAGPGGDFGPEVGMAELNSLADLFEGDVGSLEDMWEEEAIVDDDDLPSFDFTNGQEPDDLDREFADLLEANPSPAPAPISPDEDDMASLFGYDLDDDGSMADISPGEQDGATIGSSELMDSLDLPTASPEESSARADADPTPEVDHFFELEDELEDTTAAPPSAGERPQGGDDFFEAEMVAPPPVLGNDDPFGGDDPFGDLEFTSDAEDDDSATLPEFTLDLEPSQTEEPGGDHPGASPLTADLDLDDWFSAEDGADSGAEDLPKDGDLWLEADAFADDLPGESPTAEADPFLDLALEESQEIHSLEDREERNQEANPADAMAAGEAIEADHPGSDELGLADWDSPEDQAELSPAMVDGQGLGEATDDIGNIEDEDEDDLSFDDLEALLEDDDSPTGITAAGLATPVDMEEAPPNDDDEFGDLEKLLEDADQLGGSAPVLGGRRPGASGATRRVPRRTNTITDQTMRVSVSHLDTLSNLVGELVVNRNSLEQDQERLRQFLDNLLGQVSQLNDVGQRMRDLYERSLLESSLMANRQAFALGGSSAGSGSHATGATFDALEMDRFTGFHTLSQEMIELIVRVREASSDIEFTIDSTDQIARQFRQVTTQLQEGLNKARMVPFGQTAERLPRAVRDISVKCGKEARLVVEGRDTLIDKMILERLYDPMTHLVNNAITHGIESPEERQALGKPPEGTITVRAFYQGNQTVIYIADNGGGINPTVVKAKALKKGLITPHEAETMSELEVYDLLFLPGFSTRDQADDFSGRGVGMDVVRTALSEIRGSITIESAIGKGTSFTIRLPLTLSITKALSCVNNQARIAFPMDGVEDMFDVPKERIQTDDQGNTSLLWRDMTLPLRPLGDLLQFNRSLGRGRVYGGPQDEDVISMVVLRSASTFVGLQVDQVIGEQEIVIKQLEGPVPKPVGIAGATVLGDGRVMPIADVLELIDLATGRMRREAGSSLWTKPEVEEPEELVRQTEPTVLIVDDSITVRELLSMSFNKVGYRVEQARDGQEAWEKLRSGLPCDLVFCDIEMPRMDGLELLSRIQKDERLSTVPIAMLTSRGADRHRQMAVELGAKGYFTKPYLEEMLLDAAKRMLQGENMVPKG